MDCVAFFDDVLVPWERVFLLGDIGLINGTAMATGSSMHSAHQGAAKNLAKCEFVLGVALLMTQTLGNAHLPHSEERLGELMMYMELMRACMRAAEADADLDQWGVMRIRFGGPHAGAHQLHVHHQLAQPLLRVGQVGI